MIPDRNDDVPGRTDSVVGAEKLIFDKAEEAEELDLLEKELEKLVVSIGELEQSLTREQDVNKRVAIMHQIITRRTREQAITQAIKCSEILKEE